MRTISALLGEGDRLAVGAHVLTCDINEARLLVHRVMADAMRTGADSDAELTLALAVQFRHMRAGV